MSLGIIHGLTYGVNHAILHGFTNSSSSTAYTRGLSEHITFSEALARVHAMSVSLSEHITTTEAVATARALVVALSSANTFSEAVTAAGHPPSDGPGGAIFAPASAADYTLLGVTAPNNLFLCQEASGNLADSIGSLTLTANGTPTYAQAMPTGWTRKGVGFTEGANQRFITAIATGPDPSATSVMYMAYAVCDNGSPAATRNILTCGTTLAIEHNSLDRLLGDNVTTTATDSTTLPGADALVHPMVLVHDRTNSTFTMYTDEAKTVGTYNATAVDGNKGLGGAGAITTAFHGKVCYFAIWSGASAELSSAQVKSRLQALGWTIPWS